MKALLSTTAFLGFLFLLFVGSACERHPISQTIPDYEVKKAEQQKEADQQKLTPAPKAPHFFH